MDRRRVLKLPFSGYRRGSQSPHVVIALSTDCMAIPFPVCRTFCGGEL
jgi:hypothetical protein